MVGANHVRKEDLERVKLREQIHLDGQLGLFGIKLDNARARVGHPGIVDQNGDRPQILFDRLGCGEDAIVVGHVGLVEAHRVGEDTGLGFDQVEDGHFDAFRREPFDHLATNPARSASDYGNFARRVGPCLARSKAPTTLEILAHNVQRKRGQGGRAGFRRSELGVVPAETLGERANTKTAHVCLV